MCLQGLAAHPWPKPGPPGRWSSGHHWSQRAQPGMVSMQRKFSHLGIVSGIIGCHFLPVTCGRRHSRPQVLWPPGRWGEGGGSLQFLVDARSLGGAGFARSLLCFTWVHQQALPPARLMGHRAPGTHLGVSSQLLQWVPGELAGVSGIRVWQLQAPISWDRGS